MARTSVVLADERVLFLDALTRVLEPELSVVGCAQSGQRLLEAVEKHSPDVVVANVSLPGISGLEAGRRLMRVRPATRLVFLSASEDRGAAADAFELGASGYLVSSAGAAELLKTIRMALAGRRPTAPRLPGGDTRALARRDNETLVERLSPREHEVVQLVAEGRSAKEAASILGISPRTVFYHKYRAMDALLLRSSAELVRFAVRNGLA
jgi:DNA-binding NarL/FixJ family response regulator